MYKIVLEKEGEEKKLLAYSYEELRTIITLCPEVDYEIIEVKKLDYDLASEFLEEIKEDIKPDDLVFGVEKGQFLDEFYQDEPWN